MTSSPQTSMPLLPEVCAVVSGFALRNEALDTGETEFAERVNGTLVDILEEIQAGSVIDLGMAFSVVIIDLVDRLALISGEPRDGLWQTVITDFNARFARENGDNDG